MSDLHRLTVILDRADVRRQSIRLQRYVVAHDKSPPGKSSRDHGADPFHRKRPVHRQEGLAKIGHRGS